MKIFLDNFTTISICFINKEGTKTKLKFCTFVDEILHFIREQISSNILLLNSVFINRVNLKEKINKEKKILRWSLRRDVPLEFRFIGSNDFNRALVFTTKYFKILPKRSHLF